MDIGIKEVALVTLGFFLSFFPQWFDRRRKIRAHWLALRAEASLCTEKALGYIDAGIIAPLYRLPTVAFEKAFPVLLVEGELSEQESLSINRFFAHVQDINRGLDNATFMAHADKLDVLTREFNRNLSKAAELTSNLESEKSLSGSALKVMNTKLRRGWWRR